MARQYLSQEGKQAMNIIEQLDKEQMDRLSAERPLPAFAPGDTTACEREGRRRHA